MMYNLSDVISLENKQVLYVKVKILTYNVLKIYAAGDFNYLFNKFIY